MYGKRCNSCWQFSLLLLFLFHVDEFKGHSLLQAAREADMAKVKKTLALEIISFKHPQTNETALVRTKPFYLCWGLKITFTSECSVDIKSSLFPNSVDAKTKSPIWTFGMKFAWGN